ncbi:carboxylate-amine ligase [Jatrophihabitans endophyticus]|uniref:Putative glutamate--cysteine ligase 2 n=1 Tax=Jatrophihabitans endophyticus TaxID=1206085 RepID=A0A1M5ENE0_9ACTN|nr:glutamate--cysteine ligase [Jatrophihabitans endophyticus]SHF80611.1 carboxylate-amine ligase [Jatrophihabitans endophyticus]
MRTVGVEEEFLLARRSGAGLAPVAEQAVPDSAPGSVYEHEFKREQAELASDPVTGLADLERQLRDRRRTLADRAATAGARLVASGTSPSADDATTVADERYERMQDTYAQVAAVQLVCGMHIHVAVDSPDEGIRVIDRIGPWLAVLLALSANSPFWAGLDTGYASYRTVLWGQWPTAGPTAPFGDHARYEQLVADLVTAGAAVDTGMIYFNARLSATYPTVEIRVADVCPRVEDAVVIAGLARALVDTAATSQLPQSRPELHRAASWRAARYGLDAELFSPGRTAPAPAWDVVAELLHLTHDALVATGDLDVVREGVAAIRRRGNGAVRQRAAHARTGSLAAVYDDLAELTAAGGRQLDGGA